MLSSLTILDMSRVMAGPWASQLLADLGAKVIKVEHPRKGDETRQWGPPFLKDGEGNATRESAYYLSANRGKFSIGVDFSVAEGRDLLIALAGKSDVLLENYKVGTLKKHQLSYEDLSPANPRLVYCSITGFGQTGPFRDEPGLDFMIQAMAGTMSLTGEKDGEPLRVGVPMVDLMTGMYASTAILAALMNREKTGLGQYIDLSLFETATAMLANQGMNYLVSGEAPQRIGNTHPNIVPYQVFSAQDGHFIIAVGNDEQFAKLCGILDLPSFPSDPRFQTNSQRVRNREELVPLLQEKIQVHPQEWWLKKLRQQKIPCGPIRNLQEVFSGPTPSSRPLYQNIRHSLGGEVPLVVNPIRYSRTPLGEGKAPPLLGEHTEEILKGELGLSGAEILRLRNKGVIA